MQCQGNFNNTLNAGGKYNYLFCAEHVRSSLRTMQ